MPAIKMISKSAFRLVGDKLSIEFYAKPSSGSVPYFIITKQAESLRDALDNKIFFSNGHMITIRFVSNPELARHSMDSGTGKRSYFMFMRGDEEDMDRAPVMIDHGMTPYAFTHLTTKVFGLANSLPETEIHELTSAVNRICSSVNRDMYSTKRVKKELIKVLV